MFPQNDHQVTQGKLNPPKWKNFHKMLKRFQKLITILVPRWHSMIRDGRDWQLQLTATAHRPSSDEGGVCDDVLVDDDDLAD